MHQKIHGFVQGETAKTRIKPRERNQNDRLDYLYLLAHYGVYGNKAVRIKEAEALWTPYIYKNERAMLFKNFLTNMQTVFTGFYDSGYIINDS